MNAFFVDFLAAVFIAAALSFDCFAISAFHPSFLGKRQSSSQMRIITIAFVFGAVQLGFLLFGFFVGWGASLVFKALSHWISIGILIYLAVETYRSRNEEIWSQERLDQAIPQDRSFHILLMAAATSIDAFGVGTGIAIDQRLSNSILVLQAVTLFVVTILAV